MSGLEHEHGSLTPPQPIQDVEGRPASVGRADSQYTADALGVPQAGLNPDPSLPSTPHESYATPGLGTSDNTPPFGTSSDAINANTSDAAAAAGVPATKETASTGSAEALAGTGTKGAGKAPWYKRPIVWLAAFIALAIVVLVVVLPVWFVAVKPHRDHNTTSGTGKSGGPNPESPSGATSGGNGSTITAADGTSFTYINNFGGSWVYDAENPFNNSARPNSWTPPLSEPWNWSTDRIWGVNLGGLFELEPFISPELFQAHPNSVDEWTLDTDLRAGSNGSQNILAQMENYYNTFITEQDIAEIAGAGLNWIRLPIPFWAIDVWDNVGVDSNGTVVSEPFLARVSWSYILRVLGWARKYGLRINLDLHTIPGSQNGYNHSGKLGIVNFLNGVMGVANAERALEYIRVIAEFISQAEYQPVVPLFSIVNEPLLATIGKDTLTTFYLRAHDMIRNITGIGEGHGPFIAIHDGFMGTAYWAGFLQGSDRIALDTHPYFAFDNHPNNQPVNVTVANGSSLYGGQWPLLACNSWGAEMNNSREQFGVTIAGEFSNAINDCGLWVRGVNTSADYVGNCDYWENWESWSDETKAGLKQFALASMDALGDWFFWTWKIGNSSTSNSPQAPLWSYKLGLDNGWMPLDPREASGACESLGYIPVAWNDSFASWATGGAGAGTIAPTSVSQYGVWPPATINNVPTESISYLPQYTSTATVVSLPPASTYTAATVSTGNGWYDAQDRASAPTPIAGCTYPDAWSAVGSPIATAGCGAVAYAKREVPEPVVTAPPARRGL